MNKRAVALLMILALVPVVFSVNVSAQKAPKGINAAINATGSARITVIDSSTRQVLSEAKVSVYDKKGNFIAYDYTRYGSALFESFSSMQAIKIS